MARNSEIFLGGDNSTLIYLGEEEHKIYLGSDLVYQPKISIASATVSVGSKTYNGSKQTASSITVTISGKTLTVGEDYQITSNSGGTNVGNYTVTVTGIGLYKDAASGTFTINKVTPTVTAPTAKVLTYNGSAQVLATAGSTNFGTLKYSLDNSTWQTAVPAATNQGSYTLYYKVDGDSNINSVAAKSITCSINAKQVTATVELSQTTYTYNGSAFKPTVTVKDGSTVIPASEYTVTYSNNVNAGTATVTINDNTGGNYEVIGSADFTINKAAGSISYETTTVNKTYGNSAFTNALTKTGDGSVTYSSSNTNVATVNSSGQVTIKAAGSVTITATVTDGTNYTYTTKTASYTLSVAKATPTVTAPTAKNLTYNGGAQTLINAGSTTGGTIQYKLGTGSYSTSLPSATNKGSYTVYYKVVGNSNYNDVAEASVTVEIKAKALTITAKDQTVSYGTAITQGTGQVTVSGLVSGDTLTAITLTQSTVNVTTTGTITPSAAATTNGIGNYSVTYTNGKLTITAVEPIKTDPVKIGNLTYNGSAQNLVTAGTSSHGTFSYKLSTASTYGSSIPTGTNAGTYSVDWKFVADANHGGGTVTGTITNISIAQKSLTIAAKKQSVVYGTAITQGTNQVTVTGLVSGDSLTAIMLTQSTVNVTTTGTITPSAAATTKGISNYSVTYDTANLTITQKALTITAKAQTVNYGTAITQGTGQVTVTGLVTGDSLTAITLTQSTVNVTTTGTITPSAAATTNGISNYSVTYNTGVLTINKVSASVTKKPTAKSLTYNTEAQALVNAGTANGGTMYYQMTTSNSKPTNTSGFSATIPTGTNAGTYYVWYYVKGDSNHTDTAISETAVTVTINSKAIVIPTPTGVEKTYDGTAASATFSAATGATITKYRYSTDNSSWTESSSNPIQTNHGTLYTQAYYTASANYTGSGWSSSATISIAKAAPTYTAPTAKTGLVYSGSAQALLNAGSTSHGTIQYSSDNTNWGTTIPTGTNVNTYTSYWRLVGDNNHTDVSSKSLSTSIGKVTPTVTAPTAKSLTYTGSAQTLANAASTNFGTLQYSLDDTNWSTTIPTGTNAASYTVYYRVVGNSNINDVASDSITCSIGKAAGSISYATTTVDKTYGNSAFTNALTKTGDGSVTYSSSNTSIATVNTSGQVTIKAAGSATITATVTDGSNYTYATKTASYTLNVAKANLSASVSMDGWTYGGTASSPSVSGNSGGGSVTYSYKVSGAADSTYTTTKPSNAGNYVVRAVIAETANYNGATVTNTFTIAKANPAYTAPTAKTLTYNGSAQALLNAGSTSHGTIQYSSDNSTWGTSIPTGTNATSYTSYWRLVGDGNHKDVSSKSLSTSIGKVTPTVTAPTAKVLTYNGSAQTLANAASTNFGTLKYSLDNSTWQTAVPSATNQGSYTLYYKVDGDSNINSVAAKSIACSINEKEVTATVTLSQSTYTYSGSACTPTVTVKDGSTVIPASEYTVTYSNNVNAGTATVTITDNTGGNYNVTGSATFTINKANGSVTINATAPTYTGNAQSLVTVSGNTGAMHYRVGTSGSWTTTIPTGTGAGNYTVYWYMDASSNYKALNSSSSPASVAVTIAKANPSYEAPTAKTGLIYSGSAQALLNAGSTSHGTIQYSSDNSTWGTSIPTGTNATSYTSYWRLVGDGNHKDVSSKSLSTSIGKASGIAGVSSRSLSYTRGAQNLVTVSGNTGTVHYRVGTSGSWTTTIPTATNAATYTIYYYVDASTNYNGVGSSSSPNNVSTTIAKVTPVLSTSPSLRTGLNYTGSAQNLLSGGAMKHSSSDTTSVAGTFTYTQKTNAGTYTDPTWSFTPTDTTNYNSTSGKITGSVTIAKINPTYNAPTAKSGLVYNGVSQTLYNAGSNTTAGEFSYTSGTRKDAGSQTVSWTFTPTDTTNYNTKTGSFGVTIGQKEVTLSWGTLSWTYDKKEHSTTCTAGSLISGDTCYVTLTGNSITNVGTATVTASELGNSNYKLPSANTNTLTVSARTVTLTWGTTSWTYDKTAHSTTCTLGNVVSGDTCTVTLTGNSITDVGSTTVTASSLSNSNYALPSSKAATLTVTARTVTLTWGDVTWVYDGAAHSTTCKAGNLASGDTCTVTLSGNSITNKGTTTVTASSLSNSNYALPSSKAATLTVTARQINVTAGSTSKTYDGTALTYNSATAESTGTNRGLVSGHSMTSCTVTGTITTKGSADNTPSSAVIKSGSTDVTSNYSITYVKGSLTVNARAVTSTATDESWTYDGNAHSASNTGTTTNLPTGHTATYTCSGSITNAGTATKTLSSVVIKNSGGTDVSSSFTITKNNGTLTVTKANITPSVSMNGWVWGETAQSPSVSGNSGSGVVTYTYKYPGTSTYTSTAPVSKSDIGTYTVKASIAESTNYNAGEATNTFSIITNFKPSGSDALITSNGQYFEVST